MNDAKLLRELKKMKKEIAELKAHGGRKDNGKKIFSKKGLMTGIIVLFLFSSIIIYAASISKPNNFTDGTVISASQVNSNFDVLYNESNLQDTRITSLEGRNTYNSVNVKFIIATCGLYPTRDGSCNTYSEQILGEIRMYGGYLVPDGWAFCEGQILQISQNQALYSLLGTTYGGNGTTTFALPDLRGKVAVHPQ